MGQQFMMALWYYSAFAFLCFKPQHVMQKCLHFNSVIKWPYKLTSHKMPCTKYINFQRQWHITILKDADYVRSTKMISQTVQKST